MKPDQAILTEIQQNERSPFRPPKKLPVKRICLILLAALLLLHLAVSNWYLPLSEDNIRSRDNSLLTHSPFSGRLFALDPDHVAGVLTGFKDHAAVLESREEIARFCQALNSFRYFRVEKRKSDREDAVGGGLGYTIYSVEDADGHQDTVGFSFRPVRLFGRDIPGAHKILVGDYWYYSWDPLLIPRLNDPFQGKPRGPLPAAWQNAG